MRARAAWPLAALLFVAVPGAPARADGAAFRCRLPWERLADAPLLVGHFTTVYPGSSAARNANMALAARALCGYVVPTGGVFSFNQAVGPADRSHGYQKARVFVGNRIVEDYGGGVCQVVSTLYNAVVRAGLPVIERRLHGLTVPYLPPGQDATISYGNIDFQFANDTGGPIVLWAEAAGPRVTVALYGVRPGPEVRFRHRILATQAPERIVRLDPRLPAGTRRVLFPGQEGVRVHSWLIVERDGRADVRDLGEHTYRSSPRIELVGPRPKVSP